eukprot:SAG11_NODE_2101_length_3821_cov_1.700699_3_plen_141_part_00
MTITVRACATASLQALISPGTGNATHLKTGHRFNHWQWIAPLAAGLDDLDGSHGNVGGNHANTHIPEIIGSARGYELTGNKTQLAIATNFFNILTAGEGKTMDPAHMGGHCESLALFSSVGLGLRGMRTTPIAMNLFLCV